MRSLFFLSLLLSPAGAASLYTVQVVSPAGLFGGSAAAISNAGVVTGQGMDAGGNYVAFSYSPGMGPGQLALAAIGDAVNASGAIAGASWTAAGTRATVWSGGEAQHLDIQDSYATGINDSGAVAGSGINGARRSAFVHSDGETTFLDLGKWSTAADINGSGMVVGTTEIADNSFRAFAWTASGGSLLLGSLGGNSFANAVNGAGAVVGSSTTGSGQVHAFLYDGGMIDMGTLGGSGSAAFDISADGTVVGYSYTASGQMRAFVWRDGFMYDLNALVDPGSEWVLQAAYGINDHGQIVGTGMYRGATAAFLLDPAALSTFAPASASLGPSQVPEPGTLFVAAFAIAVTAAIRKFRRSYRPGGGV